MTWICGKKERRPQSTRMIGPTASAAPKPKPEQASAEPHQEEYDRLSGDGLRIKKSMNKDALWIKGDGCRISFATNVGKLRVSGDGCRVHIERNLGTVEYRGDGGHIVLGPESQQCDGVVYKGDGGLIDFAGKRQYVRCKSEAKEGTSGTAQVRHLKTRGDVRTKIVGSTNVHVNFDLRVSDKSG